MVGYERPVFKKWNEPAKRLQWESSRKKRFYYIIVCTRIFCNGERVNEKELNM
jgi:hypothetical protein